MSPARGDAEVDVRDERVRAEDEGEAQQHEQDLGGEDDGRQPEREEGGYAEGVVDRGADVAVRSGEERVRPEDALELVRLATPPCHARMLRAVAAAPSREC